MTADKNKLRSVGFKPETHRKLRRIAAQKRWTLMVAAEEAVECLAQREANQNRQPN